MIGLAFDFASVSHKQATESVRLFILEGSEVNEHCMMELNKDMYTVSRRFLYVGSLR